MKHHGLVTGTLCLLLLIVAAATVNAAPVIEEAGWNLVRTIDFESGQAAVYNPQDGLIYVGSRNSGSDGIYRIAADGTSTKLVSASRVAGLAVDSRNGDIYFSEDYDGIIFKLAFGATTPETWVSGFDSGDDDPVGLDIAWGTGNGILVDRGNGSADEIWKFSADTAQGEVQLNDTVINAALSDPVDVAVGPSGVFVVDANNGIFRLNTDETLSLINGTLDSPVGIDIDPVTGDLVVLDITSDALYRVDPITGAQSAMFSGFADLGLASWAGVDITPDGKEIIVTDREADKIYVFSSVPAPGAFILLGSGLAGLVGFARRRTE